MTVINRSQGIRPPMEGAVPPRPPADAIAPAAVGSPEPPAFEVASASASASAYLAVKAVMDRLGALLMLTLLSPAVLAAMAAVRLTSRGPAIYTQERLGRGGRTFLIYKIRSMYDRCEEASGVRWSSPQGDSRVTPVGRFLRKTHLDELPQLWNVLKGDMSLVGPRPERPFFAEQLGGMIPHYRERLEVKPGMTGLAQVQLPPDTDLESVRRKLACDRYYVRHLGFAMDARLLFGTLFYLASVPFPVTHARLGIPTLEMAERELDRHAAVPETTGLEHDGRHAPPDRAGSEHDGRKVAEWSTARPLPA